MDEQLRTQVGRGEEQAWARERGLHLPARTAAGGRRDSVPLWNRGAAVLCTREVPCLPGCVLGLKPRGHS